MDSLRGRSASARGRPVADAGDASAPVPIQAGAPTRVGKLVPLARGAARSIRRVAVVSAGAAAVVWGALFGAAAQAARVDWDLAVVAAVVLLAPAALSLLGAWTLEDLATLPARLGASAADAAARARTAASGSGSRLLGVVRVLWAARGLVLEARGGWVRVAALARLARLASLPYALGLVAAFFLNFVVIAAGLVALLVLAL